MYNPLRPYNPALEAREYRELLELIEGDPPGAVCWTLVIPRRGGKTWTLKALAHQLGARARYVDVRGRSFQAPPDLREGTVLLLDELGHELKQNHDAFVTACRALHDRGVRVVVAMTPREYAMLAASCDDGRGDVSRAILPLRALTPDEQHRMARTEDAKTLLAKLPSEWRATPFLLELVFLVIERSPRLMDDHGATLRAAMDHADREVGYKGSAWRGSLSDAQCEAVREVVRNRHHPTDAHDVLVKARVLDRDVISGRYTLRDPILADRLSVLRIHHVSDVHVGPKSYRVVDDKTRRSPVGKAIAEAAGPEYVRDLYVIHVARRKAEGDGPHMLVCSGDCVEYASRADQYADFVRWLEAVESHLTPHAAIPTSHRTVLTGGNHDVDWNLAAKGSRERHRAFAAAVSPRRHPCLHQEPDVRTFGEASLPDAGVSFALLGTSEYGGSVDEDPFRSALLDATKKIPAHALTKDDVLRGRVEALQARLKDNPVGELQAILDGLASAGLSDAERDTVQGEYTSVMRVDPGLVHARDLERLRTHAWPLPVRIAVLHHPVSPISQTEVAHYGGLINAGDVKGALLEKGFQLVLHGHVHRGWFACEQSWDNDGNCRTLWIASAPTLGSGETVKDQGYNDIEIARDYDEQGRTTYEVSVRRVIRDGADWNVTATMGPILVRA